MIIIGEKINGSIPSVAKAIAEKNEDLIKKLAVQQAAAGADFIDVCASVEDSAEVGTMKWLIDLVQQVTDVPVSVDSPSIRVCTESMKFCSRPGLLNSVSMEGDKIAQAFPLIAGTEWQAAALLNDDAGIPQTFEKRLEVFAEIMAEAKQYGVRPEQLHIDPLVEMLCTSDNGVIMIMKVMKEIKVQYPDIHITGAVSNTSFNLPARRMINQSFIVLAMNAGMDSAIIDPLNTDMMGMIYAAEALLGKDEFCMNYIRAYRQGVFGAKKTE